MSSLTRMHKDLHEFRDGWRALLASTLGVGIGLTGAPFYTMGIFLGPLGAAFGWSRAQLSGGALCLHLGYAFTAPFMGRLIDRIGVRKVALTSLLGLTVGLCLMTQIGPNIASFYGLLLLHHPDRLGLCRQHLVPKQSRLRAQPHVDRYWPRQPRRAAGRKRAHHPLWMVGGLSRSGRLRGFCRHSGGLVLSFREDRPERRRARVDASVAGHFGA